MKIQGLRWWVIVLIALATIINYIDRQALSVLWPDIVEEMFPDESALERKQIYANISIVFVFAYASCLLLSILQRINAKTAI